MRTLLNTMVILLLGTATSGPVLAQNAPPEPLVKAEGLRQLSPHVHVIPDNSVPLVPNVGFILGDKAILIIDTGLGGLNGATVAKAAARLGGSRQMYLVTTHVHPEHDLGAHALPATTQMIRSSDQEKDIAEFGLQAAENFATRSPFIADLLKDATFRKADITFTDDYTLDLGGVSVKLIAAGANHTRGDIIMWVEKDGVLFAGDLAMKSQPMFASPYSTVRQWMASLDKLEALKPRIVVPSHGPVGDAAYIAGYRTYISEVRDRTAAEKKAGKNLGQATEAVASALAPRYPDRRRLDSAVRAAYAESP
jgi:glyoxylase-like metal-dependent hydrolase (beta-lactamase superfamily II)